MKMLEISKEKFEEFASKSPYNNYCQTDNYGITMTDNGFNYTFIAYTTNNREILAAGMFLTKKIGKRYYYSYCPKGFIIDYNDADLVRRFTTNLKKYYRRKKVIFLKINPEVPIATIDAKKAFEKAKSDNITILDTLKKNGFKKRKEIEPLQLLEPKINCLLNLKEYSVNRLDDEIKEKVLNTENKGLELEIANSSKFDDFFELIKNSTYKNKDYYKKLLINFKKDNEADLALVKVNYEKFLITAKKRVEDEQIKNEELNELLQRNTTEKTLMEKMKSDKVLEEYKQDVIHATQGLRKNEDTYIAGALVIKHDNKITIIAADKDKHYDYLNPDYFLYNRLLDMYKEEYEIANIGALADDFKDNSQFKEYNQLKIDFNPTIYEYIGELDLIISEWRFKIVEKNNLLSNEFSRKRNIDNLQPTTTTYTEEEQEDYI